MATLLPRSAAYVCRSCKSRQPSLLLSHRPIVTVDAQRSEHQFAGRSRRAVSTKPPLPKSTRRPSPSSPNQTQKPQAQAQNVKPIDLAQSAPETTSGIPISSEDVQGTLRDIQTHVNSICASSSLPDQANILEVMDKAYQFANVIVFGRTTAPDEEIIEEDEDEIVDTSKDNLFTELDEPPQPTYKPKIQQTTTTNTFPTVSRERSAKSLSDAMHTLLKDPKVHISRPVLSIYVRIICQVGHPEYLPEIFFLYANKPQPILNSHPIRYTNPSPNSPKNAIPQELSDVALDTAILAKDLELAVAIIETTVGTRAFRINKFIKKASLPFALVGSTPIVAYAAADWVAQWQNSLDPNMAKAITLMGSAAYVGTLTTIGFVAATTWNDHHERVRWTEGTPLRYRWLREEERLYFDRIAMAWGFQRKRRRGEEMGGLWEGLREECGVRGMVLDKSELLPGMQ